MKTYSEILKNLNKAPKTWLITGAAGFIGSHLVEELLLNKQTVIGLDNLSAGKIENLVNFKDNAQFTFYEGDIRDIETCMKLCENVDYVLHHAAIGSVMKSIETPALTDEINNGGFIKILLAAQKQKVKRVIYASSSAIYGQEGEGKEKTENDLPLPMSPYAASKCANEHYARSLSNTHDIETVGLRYFNIYGPRQDPNGAYAAVIPKWIDAMIAGEDITIFGDGSTVRDFCYIDDVIQANILAATSNICCKSNSVYNIASGQSTTLNELFLSLKELTGYTGEPVYKNFRPADIKVSKANISKAQKTLGFKPYIPLKEGLGLTVEWFKGN